MANENKDLENIYSNNDTLDINELASLNDDISAEFIEQLQNKVAQTATAFTGKNFNTEKEDFNLFEEVPVIDEQNNIPIISNEDIISSEDNPSVTSDNEVQISQEPIQEKAISTISLEIVSAEGSSEIENLTSGNIIEKPLNQNQLNYNDSLDYLDENVKYSKYVIYVNPENKDFIDSLTVKERKNLINRLLREQDDIAITKRRLVLIQSIIKHTIIAIITIAVTIPIAYWTINASLEASINNYRRSKIMFKTLYREKGKIKTQSQY